MGNKFNNVEGKNH